MIDLLNIHYWSWIATFYLMLLTYQDYKHNMNVDDRRNFFMMGLTISLISHVKNSIWYLLGIIVIVFILNYWMKKTKLIGEGDVNAISWIYTGFALLRWDYLLWYGVIFAFTSALYMILKWAIWHKEGRYKQMTPFFGVILLSFWLNCFIFGLY